MKIYDNSQLSEFQECPRRYRYRYIDRIKLPGGPEAAFSSWMVHEPLAGWYLHGDKFNPDWQRLWQKYLDEVGDVFPPTFLTLDLAKKMYRQYTEKFRSDLEGFEVLSVESVLPTPIRDFFVKPDVVLLRKCDGRIWVMDHKTSKYPQDTVIFDRQFVTQIAATGAVGFIKNFWQIETEYEQRRTKSTKGGSQWIREEHLVPKDFVDEWLLETVFDLGELELAEANDIYPKRSKNCHRGRWTCPALSICEAGGLRNQMIKGLEKVEDPLKYLKGNNSNDDGNGNQTVSC